MLGAEKEYNWRDLMTRWGREMLASRHFAETLGLLRSEYPGLYTDDVLSSGWLGFPPASDAQISATEKRLGLTLPPDYKAFLKITNGCRAVCQFINRVWPVEEVDWLSSTDPDYVSAWVQASEGQADPLYESKYIGATLQISDQEYAGDAVLLLNPEVVSPAGEWEAWFMASWNPGANRYMSFWEMMQERHKSFLYVEAAT